VNIIAEASQHDALLAKFDELWKGLEVLPATDAN